MAQSGSPSQPFDQPLDLTDLELRQDDTSLLGPVEDVAVAPMAELGAAGEEISRREASLWGDAWHRLIRNKLAVLGIVIVTVFTVMAIAGPYIAPYGQNEIVDVRLALYKPSWTWPMGLDPNGRDIFSRLLYGARVSFLVGVLSQLIVLAIGIPIGAIAGYYGGQVDNLLMRVVDVVYAIPQLLLVILFVNWWGTGMVNIFLAIGLVSWVTVARLVRGQFLSLREQEYIKASKVAGARGFYIIARHLVPNSLTPIIVAVTFGIPTAIFTEAALSYVGVGILPPQASWGQMIGVATSRPGYIQSYPHVLLFPVLAIGLTMLGFTFLGDGLRDALDPKGND